MCGGQRQGAHQIRVMPRPLNIEYTPAFVHLRVALQVDRALHEREGHAVFPRKFDIDGYARRDVREPLQAVNVVGF